MIISLNYLNFVYVSKAFAGVGLFVQDAESKANAVVDFGGSIITKFDEYGYGACMIPDEDELKIFPVSYAKVTDPDGYAIELKDGSTY